MIDPRHVPLVRCAVAAVAAAVLLCERYGRFPARRRLFFGILGLCAVLGVGAFYNLGYKQFWNERRGAWTFIHYPDHRQTYGTAKYFREIGYRGAFRADMAAYLEDTGAGRESVA
ncbi:MAG TPA: hypothetical protein VLJ37_06315, partial [bacterium]|nr:hypothetical protein [bacterium]